MKDKTQATNCDAHIPTDEETNRLYRRPAQNDAEKHVVETQGEDGQRYANLPPSKAEEGRNRHEAHHAQPTELHTQSDEWLPEQHTDENAWRAQTPTVHHGDNDPESADMPTPGDLLAHRYRLLRTLGAGAFGRVFYAYDEEQSHPVAIKVLKNTRPNALLHFKREFRAIAELRHPNLVRVHQLVRDRDTWFIVMEMIEGVAFVPWMLLDRQTAPLPDGARDELTLRTAIITRTERQYRLQVQGSAAPLRHKAPLLSVERIQNYFYQLARGVHSLHQMHVVHCDLKPSNIIVTPEDRVVILDFGVVRHMLHLAAQNQDEGLFAGTRNYIAPEVTPTSTPQTSFDWYAVGVILWQFLTGYPADHLEALKHTQRVEFLRNAAAQFEDYRSLFELCIQLLEPTPSLRATYDDIERICAPKHAPNDTPPPSKQPPTALAGRADVLEILHNTWRAFHEGTPQTVLIEGSAGIGKTALCEAFLHEVQRHSASTRVLLAQCQNNESVGFRAFDEIVDGLTALIASMAPDDREETLHLCTPTLCQLFPVLRSLDPRLENPPPTDATSTDPRFALRELLCHVAERCTMVIWIEDIDSADEDSLQWIGQIFTPALRPNAFLLITKNSRIPVTNDRFDIETLGYAIHRIPLKPIGNSAARELVKHWLPAADTAHEALVERIVRISAGRPQMLHMLCLHTRDVHALEEEITGAALLAQRIAALSQNERDLLAVAAISSRPVPLNVFAFMTGQTVEALNHPLDALLDAFLIRHALIGDAQEFEIVHEDVRQSVLYALEEDNIRALHTKLVRAAHEIPSFRMRPLTLLSHLLHAEDYPRAERAGRRFARIAERNGAYAAAAQIYQRLIDMARDQHVRIDPALLSHAVELHIQAGQLLHAADLLAELADDATVPAKETALRQRAEEIYILCGHLKPARAQKEKQEQNTSKLRHAMPKPPRLLRIAWLKERLIHRIQNLDLATLHGNIKSDDLRNKMRMFRMSGLDLGLVDPVLGLEFAMRELHAAIDSQHAIYIARALAGVSPIFASASKRELELGIKWTDLAIALGQQYNDPTTVQWARICQGNIDYQRGEYAVGWRKLRTGRAWLERHASAQSMMIAYANSHLIYCAWAMGNVPALRAAYYGQLGDVRARKNQVLEAAITIGGFNTWLIDDAPEAAHACLQELDFPDTGGPFRLLDFFKMYYGGEIALYQDNMNEVEDYIAALIRFETTLIARMIAPVRNAARFLLARMLIARAAHTRQEKSYALFAQLQAIGWRLRNGNEVLGCGWGHQILGASHLLRGNRAQARKYYQRAIDHFDQLGIGIFAEPTRAAAIACGVMPSASDPYERLRDMGVVRPYAYTRITHPYVPAHTHLRV